MSQYVRISKLHYAYGDAVIIPSLNFQVKKGSFVCLLGPSGSGKTTLLRLMAGLEKVRHGEIELDGKILSSATAYVSPDQRSIGMVFQQPTLFPTMRVDENVGFGIRHYPQAQRAERVQTLLKYVGLEHKAAQLPHQLSGGQQHRVALARALAPQLKLLLLDEPFAHLDPDLRKRLRQQTLDLVKEEGVTCMMVTHDAEEAMQLGDHIILLDNHGNIRQQGTAHDIYHQPVDMYAARALGDVNILAADSDGKHIQSPLGVFKTASNLTGNILLGVRPEDIQVSASDDAACGVVEHVLCTGPEDHLDVCLKTGETLSVRVPHDHHFSVGDHVSLQTNEERLQIFALEE